MTKEERLQVDNASRPHSRDTTPLPFTKIPNSGKQGILSSADDETWKLRRVLAMAVFPLLQVLHQIECKGKVIGVIPALPYAKHKLCGRSWAKHYRPHAISFPL